MWYLIGIVAMFLFLLIEYKQENQKQTEIDLITVLAALFISLFWFPIIFVLCILAAGKIIDKLNREVLKRYYRRTQHTRREKK